MLTSPSKGGTDLANAFLQNKATQPAKQLPTITQPVQRSMPQLPQAPQQSAPVMGSMAPAAEQRPVGLAGLGIQGVLPQAVKIHNAPGMWTQQQTPDGLQWVPYNAPAAAPQQTYQPSQAQLLARAINERAQKR